MSSVERADSAALPDLMELVEFKEAIEVYWGFAFQVELCHAPIGTIDEATLNELFPSPGAWVRTEWDRSGFVSFRRVVGEPPVKFVGPVPDAQGPMPPDLD
jgi:hypothetical protein